MRKWWLFDAYALDDRIVLWAKDGRKTRRIERQWTPSIYVASDNKDKLKNLSWNKKIFPFVKRSEFVERYEKAQDTEKSTVLKLQVKKTSDLTRLAKAIEGLGDFGAYRLYNVDIPPEQAYLYEHDLFPLGKYNIQGDRWTPLSKIEDTDYELPELTTVDLRVVPKKERMIANFSDRIDCIQLDDIAIQANSEKDTMLECVDKIRDMDPDIIVTEKGDSWDLPYLAHRAKENNISDRLVLGREKNYPLPFPARKGTSFFAYGQIYYKPSSSKLLGKAHIDKSNCFMWEHEHSLDGLYEIARTCRLPLQTAARASIGKCMSSVQFYYATKRGLLIPWKPVLAERFKSRSELFAGDRGGLIIEPRIGVYENVAELDFVSLFATIMIKKNISAETIECRCCPHSDSIVPELGYRICRRRGIVPEALELLVTKRSKYSKLGDSATDKIRRDTYNQWRAALKWILVTSFGYLGFNNAKFGRIDAHMAVCALARDLLKRAMHIAEDYDFRVLYGNVDSVWIQKSGATRTDYNDVRRRIEEGTGFDMSLEIYNWLAFLPSKENKKVPVPNRYFGALQGDKLKLRGLETRRHDTPEFFKKCQTEILELFAKCKTVKEVRESIPKAREIQKRYSERLHRCEVPLAELVFTNRLTRGNGEYSSNTVQADAVNQLKWEGLSVVAGQKIRYVVSDNSRKISRLVVPIELTKTNDDYDVKRYSDLLDECCKSVIEPFV